MTRGRQIKVSLSGVALGRVVGIAVLGIALRASAEATFVSMDYPGAVATFALDINDVGQIVGEYAVGGLSDRHGFLLNGGSITSIDYPGATFTRAVAINRYGDIVGDHQNSGNNNGNGNQFGYLLRNGVFTSLQVPNSDTTIPAGINSNRDVVGWYIDKKGTHGFLLSAGVYSSIDFPGAAAFTQAWKINDAGEILGRYVSGSDGKNHVFVLIGGSFTSLPDVPGGVETGVLEVGGMNGAGQIVSTYCSAKSCALFKSIGNLHAFLWSEGVYTTFDFPGATETFAIGVNASDEIVGGYQDASGRLHGYLRMP